MQRLLKKERLLLGVAISSVAIGTVSIAGIIFCITKLWYVPMAVCILLTAHGFYGSPFYFLRRADLKICRRILLAAQQGARELEVIAVKSGVKSLFAAKLIQKLIKKGYLSDFDFDGSTLSRRAK